MESDTIFYLYAKWHASIFDSLCVGMHARMVNFGTFGGVVKPPEKNYLFYFLKYCCILIVYIYAVIMHIFKILII